MDPHRLKFDDFTVFDNETKRSNIKYTFTFAMIKPQAVIDGKTGPIIQMIEENGFGIYELHKLCIPLNFAENLYIEHKDKEFYQDLCKYVQSGDVVAMCLVLPIEKGQCWSNFRQLMTRKNGIRDTFGVSQRKNAIHGSGNEEDSKRELSLFFNFLQDNAVIHKFKKKLV